jgi:hypothetical protein
MPININNFWIVNKAVLTQFHTSECGKFNNMRWDGVKWHNLYIYVDKPAHIFSKDEKGFIQTQRYKLVFILTLM